MTTTSSCSFPVATDVAAGGTLNAVRRPAVLASPIDPQHLQITGGDGEHLGAIEFDISPDGERLTPAEQKLFRDDFCGEIARLRAWAAERNWPAPAAPEFRVVVSGRYRISKSLVPAWSGRAGAMEFPAWRVAARKAAILHELVHVFLPNGNRLLAEGLAIHLQAAIGGNPAFPNFGRPLHALVRQLLPDMTPGFLRGNATSLEPLHLAELDSIATPNPLTLRVGDQFHGEEPRGQARVYPLAGSFVRFLIETRGLEAFRRLYDLTPLVPLRLNPGSPDRWADIYGIAFADIEWEWKSLIATD